MSDKEKVINRLMDGLICTRCGIDITRDIAIYTENDEVLCEGCEAKRLSKINML
jgi:DNA-directed RNA polymerase subunit RPC12/RpoP